MKFLGLIAKNLRRNKLRTSLTVSSIAVSLFLVATLRTILTELENPVQTPDSALRLVVRHRISLFNILPKAHQEKIAALEGVEGVVGQMWFGGYYKDPGNFFANFSTDTEGFWAVFPDVVTPPDQKEAFFADRTGALVGKKLAERFGWKLGQRITLIGTLWNFNPELTVRAFYEGGSDEGNSLFFHWEYFNEGFGNNNFVGTYTIKVASRDDAPRVAEAVDKMFRSGLAPTKTESEKAFLLGFVEMLGDVRLFITSIVAVVVFTIILIAGNTMAMSIRERTREIGIMKALGYRTRHLLGLLLGEAVFLTLGASLMGAVSARLIFSSVDMTEVSMGFLQRFYVTPATIGLAAGVGVTVGLLAAGIPALTAARKPVVDALGRE